jgi:hypothetical protein
MGDAHHESPFPLGISSDYAYEEKACYQQQFSHHIEIFSANIQKKSKSRLLFWIFQYKEANNKHSNNNLNIKQNEKVFCTFHENYP